MPWHLRGAVASQRKETPGKTETGSNKPTAGEQTPVCPPCPPSPPFPMGCAPPWLFGTQGPTTPFLLSRRSSSLGDRPAPWDSTARSRRSWGQDRGVHPCSSLPAIPSLPCSPRLLSPHLRGAAGPGHRQRPRLPAAAGGRGQEPAPLPGGGGHGDEVPGPEAQEAGNGHQLHPGTRQGLPRGAAFPNSCGQELLEPAEGTVPKMGCGGAVGWGHLNLPINGIFQDFFLLTEWVVSQAGPVPVCPQGNGDVPSPLRDGL